MDIENSSDREPAVSVEVAPDRWGALTHVADRFGPHPGPAVATDGTMMLGKKAR